AYGRDPERRAAGRYCCLRAVRVEVQLLAVEIQRQRKCLSRKRLLPGVGATRHHWNAAPDVRDGIIDALRHLPSSPLEGLVEALQNSEALPKRITGGLFVHVEFSEVVVAVNQVHKGVRVIDPLHVATHGATLM